MQWAYKKHSGFTIVELLIVVVVIAILAAITIVAYNGITSRTKTSVAASTAQQAANKLASWSIQNNETFPADKPAFLTATGLTESGGTTYQYTLNSSISPNLYCVTVTTNGVTSHIATNGVPTDGPCNGHTGTAPTTLADGSTCPSGYIVVPGSSLFGTKTFCAMKYEAKNVGGVATSQAAGTPWVSITQTNAVSTSAAACTGCHLITDNEWLTIAHNLLSVDSNWSGGSVGSGYMYVGHSDGDPTNALVGDTNDANGYGTGVSGGDTGQTSGNQRRTLTLTNGQVIWDMAGNIHEWVQGSISPGQLPGVSGDSGFTWRQYNISNLIMNSLSTNDLPVYGTGAAAAWTGAQGIGGLYTNLSDNSSTRGFLRGGGYTTGTGAAGVMALNLSNASASSSSNIGFRVAR